jgi:hypothetical protein
VHVQDPYLQAFLFSRPHNPSVTGPIAPSVTYPISKTQRNGDLV